MGDLQSFRVPGAAREQAGPDHIRALLQRLRLSWLLQRFPPGLVRALYVSVNSFHSYDRRACAIGAGESKSVCVSVARTHSISTVLFPAFQSLQSAQYDLWSPDRAYLRLWRFRCHGRRSRALRRAPRHLLATNPGGGSLVGATGHAWSYSKSAIRQPEPRR